MLVGDGLNHLQAIVFIPTAYN